MRNKAVYHKFLRKEVLNFFKFKNSARSWHIPILAGLAVGIPLLTGYYFNDIRSGLTASLAGLVILYTPTNGNLFEIMTKMFVCSFGMIVSYTLALFFSFYDITAILGFGLISGATYFVNRFFIQKPPGSFFFIMIASMAIAVPHELNAIPRMVGLFTLGTFTACFLVLLYSLLFLPKALKTRFNTQFKVNPYVDFREVLVITLFMMLSIFIGKFFNLEYPYWIPISCLAVLQGVDQYSIWKRGFHRIIGTLAGMLIVWGIFSLTHSALVLCFSIIILQIIVELLITRHYALTVVFLTPLGVLLAETGSSLSADPNHLLQIRFLEIILGSILGVWGGWFLFNERLQYKKKRYEKQSKAVVQKSLDKK